MKKNFLFLILALLNMQIFGSEFARIISAHDFVNIFLPEQNYGEKIASITRIRADKYKGYKGSPYLEDEFIEGSMVLNDSINIVNIELRYNMYEEIMEFKHNDIIFSINKPEKVSYLMIGDKKFKYSKYYNKTSTEGYFEVVEDGDCSLLIKYFCSLTEVEYNSTISTAKSFLRFSSYKAYFLKKSEKEALKIKRKKTNVVEFLADNKGKLDEYIKSNKLNMKKLSDFVQLISYYNSLL